MLAPWNEIRPKKYPSPGMPVVQLWQNLCNPSYAIPLGFTPCNVYPACLRAPREIHISDGAAYFTGVAKSDRIGEDRLNLLHRGVAILLGVRQFFKQVSHKAPSTHIEGGAFLFCLPHEAGP